MQHSENRWERVEVRKNGKVMDVPRPFGHCLVPYYKGVEKSGRRRGKKGEGERGSQRVNVEGRWKSRSNKGWEGHRYS